MRYIDAGDRQPASALGTWLLDTLDGEVEQLRVQTGFFSADGLPAFVDVLKGLHAANGLTTFLIGSNDSATLHPHLSLLMELMGVPRSNAQLGVVSFSPGYFHPKTYHITRKDKSSAAYVGSANLSHSGVTSLHVEAGIILDSRDGDQSSVLDQIATSIDNWFLEGRAGLEVVQNMNDLDRLLTDGFIRLTAPPRSSSASSASSGSPKARLSPLIELPALPLSSKMGGATIAAASAAPVSLSVPGLAVPRNPPYPDYMLFAPGATTPTVGTDALTGTGLPGGQVGLIYQLNRDSTRHWHGRVGTANISIPVATVSTIRFGEYPKGGSRPRAEFDIDIRYLHSTGLFGGTSGKTNVMAYGYGADTGHRDTRFVVPIGPARDIGQIIQDNGKALPAPNDLCFIEWPTLIDPVFRISLLEQGSPVQIQAQALFDAATGASQLVGRGACWLPPGLSPSW